MPCATTAASCRRTPGAWLDPAAAGRGRSTRAAVPRRRAVASIRGCEWVWTEERLRLVEPGDAGELIDVGEHVTTDQRTVGLAPQRDVAGRVARGVQHLEATHHVPLAQPLGYWVRWPGPHAIEQRVDRVLGLALADPAVLDRVGVALPTPQRDVQRFAHLVACPLVVRVGVGDCVGVDVPAPELAENPLAGPAGGGVDQDIGGKPSSTYRSSASCFKPVGA